MRAPKPPRPHRPGRNLRSFVLGEGFGALWPDAPDAIVTWIARLNDVEYADVYAWADLMVAHHDRDGIDARDYAIMQVQQHGHAPADVVAALKEMSMADFRKLLTIMERA